MSLANIWRSFSYSNLALEQIFLILSQNNFGNKMGHAKRQIQADTTRYKQIQADTTRYKQIQADTSRYDQIRPDTNRYKQIQTDTNRYKQIQLIKAKFK